MFHVRLASILLIAISSNLQSCFVAQATNIACGSIATFGPTPLVAGQSSATFTVSRLDSQDQTTYVVHGNSDNTCRDAYTVTLSGTSTVINTDMQLTYFKGSESYKMCMDGVTTVCSVPRLIPFFNPRQGAWKDTMLSLTPVPVWVAANAAPSTTFTVSVKAGTYSFTTLVANGYTFPFALSLSRQCTTLQASVPWASIAVTPSALSFNVSGLASGVYSICMKILANNSLISNYFPISGVLGHSVHNLKFGVPSTDVKWEIVPLYLSRLTYATVTSSDIRFIAEKAIVNDGWTSFGIDTSADICSPLLSVAFTASQLQPYNSTHVYVDMTVPLPVGAPGGGEAVLCGALTGTSPWTLLSTSPYFPWIYNCPVGYGVTLPTALGGCSTCAPSSSNQCYGNGYCGTFENKTNVRSSASCICFPRFYSAQTNCDRYDLDAPVLAPGNGTYKTKHLLVTMSKPATADWAVVMFNDGTQYQCNTNCTFIVTETTTVTVESTSSNLSHTLVTPTYSYVIIPPTTSTTLTMSPTLTMSVTQTKSPSHSESLSNSDAGRSESNSLSQFSSTSTVRVEPPKLTPQPPFRKSTSKKHGVLATETTSISQTFSNQLPGNRVDQVFSLTLRPEANYSANLQGAQGNFTSCDAAVCTAGLTLSCRSLLLVARFVSPSDLHYCNASFSRSGGQRLTYTWQISFEPILVTVSNLYYSASPAVVTVLRYRAASIPYMTDSQEVSLRSCDSDVWTNSTLHIQRGKSCISLRVVAAGFVPYLTTLQLDFQQSSASQSSFVSLEPMMSQETAPTTPTQQPSLTPGGVILGVTTGVVLSLFFLTQIIS